MPSKDIARRRAEALDTPGLSANQIRAAEDFYDRIEKLENHRHRKFADKVIADVNQQVEQTHAEVKQALIDYQEKVKQARGRRISAVDLAQARSEMQRLVEKLEGKGDSPGLLTSYEGTLARQAEIKADPGPYADRFWATYPNLGDRFRVSDREWAEYQAGQ